MSATLKKLAGVEIDTSPLHKQLISAHTEIALLKGACFGLPNPQLLLSPTVLQEALASSEVENIVTTLADVLQAQLFPESERTPADKEVLRYNLALRKGIDLKHLPLGGRVIEAVHDTLLDNQQGYRKTQNALRNQRTGQIVYTPPPANLVSDYISDLESFIHKGSIEDPLIKTAMAHYQFEAIHPFGDGNGRTGRILMVLCMLHFGLLDLPVLFTSAYIAQTKVKYYEVIKNVTENEEWLPYLSYMLTAFTEQAKESTKLLLSIKDLHDEIKRRIRKELPKIYSRDMVDAIFSSPIINPTKYGEILKVAYQTGSSHLKQLEARGFMESLRVGKYHLFVNKPLMELINSLND